MGYTIFIFLTFEILLAWYQRNFQNFEDSFKKEASRGFLEAIRWDIIKTQRPVTAPKSWTGWRKIRICRTLKTILASQISLGRSANTLAHRSFLNPERNHDFQKRSLPILQ